MACPEMAVDFMLLEHIGIPFIGALYTRDWKSIYAMWCLYYLPSSIVFLHMFDSDIDIKLMVFAWNALFALAGAFLGEWVSVFWAFPRLFDIRGVRDAYARVYNWDPTVLILSVFAGYWGVMAFIGHLSGSVMMMPECSMGLSRTEELIVGGVAIGIAIVGILVVVIIALVPSTFDYVDRRLNLKYAGLMALRMFVHYWYDMSTMAMWHPAIVGGVFLAMIVVYWVLAYLVIGFVNVHRGLNRGFLRYSNTKGSVALSEGTIMDDRWSSVPQAQAFVLVGGIIDLTLHTALVVGDQFSGFSNHQTILIVAGAAILFWAIVSAITPRLVYSLWAGWDRQVSRGAGYVGYTDKATIYEMVFSNNKNMEAARLDLHDSPGGANRPLDDSSARYVPVQQTTRLIGSPTVGAGAEAHVPVNGQQASSVLSNRLNLVATYNIRNPEVLATMVPHQAGAQA